MAAHGVDVEFPAHKPIKSIRKGREVSAAVVVVNLKTACIAMLQEVIGRGERIRTSGPCLPKAVLYQAELHPVICFYAIGVRLKNARMRPLLRVSAFALSQIARVH